MLQIHSNPQIYQQNIINETLNVNPAHHHLQQNQQQSYKFNSNYINSALHQHGSHHNLQSHQLQHQSIDYYAPKAELMDEGGYDSPKGMSSQNGLNPTSDYSSLSSSSSTSSSSSSSSSSYSSMPTESISINISNPSSASSTTSSSSSYHHSHHYGTYFNGLNQPYGYSNCLNDTNKFYAATNSYSFYNNNPNNTNPSNTNSSPGYGHYNSSLNHHFGTSNHLANPSALNDANILLNTNLHSNSSSVSSCSSTSSSVSGMDTSHNLYTNGNHNLSSIAAVGVLGWSDGIDPHATHNFISSKMQLPINPIPTDASHHHSHLLNHNSYSDNQFSVNSQASSSATSSTGSSSYNDLLSCANNAAAMAAAAAAKYSCAAAASSSYCPYPFAVDEYNSSVSQIQVNIFSSNSLTTSENSFKYKLKILALNQ